jgi:hypothetical protein
MHSTQLSLSSRHNCACGQGAGPSTQAPLAEQTCGWQNCVLSQSVSLTQSTQLCEFSTQICPGQTSVPFVQAPSTQVSSVAVETVAAVGIGGTRNTGVLILEANLAVLARSRTVCTGSTHAGLLAVAEEPVAAVGIDRALNTAVTVLETHLAVLTGCHTICTNTACTGLITVAEELVLTICV